MYMQMELFIAANMHTGCDTARENIYSATATYTAEISWKIYNKEKATFNSPTATASKAPSKLAPSQRAPFTMQTATYLWVPVAKANRICGAR